MIHEPDGMGQGRTDKAMADALRIEAEIGGRSDGTDPFAAAVRTTRMPMIITDPRLPDNPAVFVNDAFVRLTGYERDEILGRNCRFLQGAETDPEAIALVRDAIQSNRSIEIDLRNHRKDGEPFWNRLLLAPVRDAAGEVAYFFASQVDVTLEREQLAGLESRNSALSGELAVRLREKEESEARLRFATGAARLGIWELDLQTQELTTSPLCKANFGRDAASPLTYPDLIEAVHPGDRARMQEAVRAAVAGGGVYDIDYRVLLPGGAVGWVQILAQVMRSADGTPVRMAGVCLDVTERREADARLEFSEQSLRLATEAAEIGTWDLDLGTEVLTWSERTKAMFGISRDGACDMGDFYGGLHPDDRMATSAAFASAIDPAARATYDVEYRTVGKEDGVIRWVAAKGRGLFDEGTCTRAIGTAVDITEKKSAERRQNFLVELWERLSQLDEPRAVIATAAEALGCYLDADHVVFGVLETGAAGLAVQGGFMPPTVAPEDVAARLDAFGAAIIARQRQGTTVACGDVAADPACDDDVWAAIGTRAFVSVPLLRDGQLRALLSVGRADPTAWRPPEVSLVETVARRTWDAVERAWAVAALRDANAHLAERVAAAVAEQERIGEALRQAQKMEAVGQLTGGLAHDFNNLLTGIVGSLELLETRLGQGRTADLGRYLGGARDAASRATALTHRLLAFSRRQTLAPKPTDVTGLAAGMTELIRRTIGPAIRLEFSAGPCTWTALVDQSQLENSLLNLCINARDAMPDGGLLTIETGTRQMGAADAAAAGVAEGDYVTLAVTDTGVGMPADVVEKAFEPFFTTKPIGSGTGLGLSMIYGFAKQSGGQVRISSVPGEGTTVCIYLPRNSGTADIPDEQDSEPVLARHRPGGTVLVVDDEPTVRTLAADVLSDLGFTVLEAEAGPAALGVLDSRDDIELLVTDVGLAGMNGRQLADAARVNRPTLKVLFITGYADTAVLSHSRLDPGMHLMTKPFAMAAFGSVVTEILAAG